MTRKGRSRVEVENETKSLRKKKMYDCYLKGNKRKRRKRKWLLISSNIRNIKGNKRREKQMKRRERERSSILFTCC